MFWGLNLKANRKYSQTTSKSFHISQAALDTESGAGPARLFLTYENEKFLVCTLRKGECEQVMLDYNFAEGDEISFESKGAGNVALTGYIVTDDMEEYMNGDEEDSELEEVEAADLRAALNKKKAKKAASVGNAEEDEDEDDEDDEDFDAEHAQLPQSEDDDDDDDEEEEEGEEEDDDDDEEGEEDDVEEEDEDEEDEEEADEPVEQPKQKKAKLENQAVKQNGVAKNAEKDKKKKKNKEQQVEQPNKQGKQQQQPAGARVISGGVKIEDIRVGNGPEAKPGKRAQVYYEGRLKSNNKVFDSSKQGAGFKFSVGRGEVIKGWDIGVVGMKVGGKRRITCPPHMAYGARGAPPSIPPNSTLVFEVELKGVN